MARKQGSENHHPTFKYVHCDFTLKMHVSLVLHSKEVHDVEL